MKIFSVAVFINIMGLINTIYGKRGNKFKDLTDKKFGRLTVISLDHISSGKAYWKCQCDCGNFKIIRGCHLGKSIFSCKCLQKELLIIRIKTHGLSNNRTHRIWRRIMYRCYNIKTKEYVYYGGRGIKVCEDWHKFENFYRDMGDIPEKLTIDRIDNNGNYCKENCRFANYITQARNRRNNRLITFEDKTQTFTEWVIEKNITHNALYYRLDMKKWELKRALNIPLLRVLKNNNITN